MIKLEDFITKRRFVFVFVFFQEMQEDQQKQLKDMKENIGYYQKKAQELEVRYNAMFPFTRLQISLATAYERRIKKFETTFLTSCGYNQNCPASLKKTPVR